VGQIVAIVVVLLLVALVGGTSLAGAAARRRAARSAVRVPQLVSERLRPGPAPSPPPPSEAVSAAALTRALAARPRSHSDDADAYRALGRRLDPVSFRPRVSPDVESRIFRLRWGNDYAIVANTRRLVHYELQVHEAELLPMMDGTRTVAELVVEQLDDTGGLDVPTVATLVRLLHAGHILDPDPVDVDAALVDRLDPDPPSRRRLRAFLKTLTYEWSGADRFVRACYKAGLRLLFTPIGFVAAAAVAIAGLIAFIEVQASGTHSLSGSSAPAESMILILLSFVLTFAHELGHATVLIHYGRRIRNAGFMIYFGSPAFFVDATDGLLMGRGRRILQAGGGPFAEMILAGIGSLALWLFPDSPFADLLYTFAVLNYFVIFMNLIPLLELDGYYILADLIQVPDLRARSLQFIQHDVWHHVRSRERFTPQEIGLGLYGVIGIAFTVFSIYTAVFFWEEIFGGLVAAAWNGGIGSRLLLVVLALFLAGPAIRGLITLARSTAKRVRGIYRKVQFRIETGWRVEAAELIDGLPAFEDLPGEVLSDLAGRVRLIAVRPGQWLFRQGDRPAAFYVVRNGLIRIEDEDPQTGDTRVLSTLGRGDSFGEVALLGAMPRRAGARAETDAELFEVDKGTFDRLLADQIHAPEFGHTMQTLAELRELAPFAHLTTEPLAELLGHGDWITAAPGDELVRQGEPGDAFYAVASGRAEVVRDGEVVAAIGPGGHFGELALLHGAPRNASVRARTPLRAYRLDREGFDAVVADAFRGDVLRTPTDRTWEH
jgi:CRP-like cAMP-binding protein/Zn-dependent protease